MAGDGEAALLKGLLLEKEGESIGAGTLEGGRFNSRPTGARSRPAGAAASAKKAIEDGRKLLAPSHPERFVVCLGLGGPPCRS